MLKSIKYSGISRSFIQAYLKICIAAALNVGIVSLSLSLVRFQCSREGDFFFLGDSRWMFVDLCADIDFRLSFSK